MKLTQLARRALEACFRGKKFKPDKLTLKKFSKKRACFVTLTKKGNLRGCIGSLHAQQELWKDVVQNAVLAGFNDFRFPPLKEEELKDIKIEVSVLTKPKKILFKSPEELLKKIKKTYGIVLRKNKACATFLPQVWKEIPDKTSFLEHLSLKAGLNKDEWKDSEIFYYSVKKEKEN